MSKPKTGPVSLCWDGGDPECWYYGHLPDEEATGAYLAWLDEQGEASTPEKVGRCVAVVHTYARWVFSSEGLDGDLTREFRTGYKPGPGAFKVTGIERWVDVRRRLAVDAMECAVVDLFRAAVLRLYPEAMVNLVWCEWRREGARKVLMPRASFTLPGIEFELRVEGEPRVRRVAAGDLAEFRRLYEGRE